MKIKRNFVTPYLTFVFLVVGFSGILMFFHLFDDYTKVVHELLGLTFVLFSALHIIINWTSLKSHFRKKIFITSGVVVLLISVAFIILEKVHGNNERIVIEKLVKAPISSSFTVLNVDYNKAKIILKNNNITIGDSKTIEEICVRNQKSSNEIIELIVK
ncbi:MAG: DUF4405 domain-containing protein [Bacteroidia bacterium]|nr:DUF4405 domain-containing protein [Bacteroidia bacterium]